MHRALLYSLALVACLLLVLPFSEGLEFSTEPKSYKSTYANTTSGLLEGSSIVESNTIRALFAPDLGKFCSILR